MIDRYTYKMITINSEVEEKKLASSLDTQLSRDLNYAKRLKVISSLEVCEFKDGENVFKQGDISNDLPYIW